MLSKSQFLDSFAHETTICKHLHGKLNDGLAAYRPQDGMRSTIELLRYLARCGIAGTYGVVRGTWDVEPIFEEAAAMELPEFPALMDRQSEEVADLLSGVSNQDFGERMAMVPWRVEMPLARALVETSLKFMTAYRMQLFLYAKQSGVEKLGTSNCWFAMDIPE